MSNKKMTKRALMTSVLAIVMCLVMLIGSTFAWFTDTASTGVNKIQSGTLDIDVEYSKTMAEGSWQTVQDATNLFTDKDGSSMLWEPGVASIVYLRITNKGNLAVKYTVQMTVANEKTGMNVNGGTLKLSDYIKYGYKTDVATAYADRDAAIADVSTSAVALQSGDLVNDVMTEANATKVIALVVYMPTTVGNDANYRGEDIPSIDLGITVNATQYTYESDSFNDQYDNNAQYSDVEYIGANDQDSLKDALGKSNDPEAEKPAYIGVSAGEYTVANDTTIGEGTTLAGAGADKTVLKTEEKNYTVSGDNVTIKDITVDGTEVSSVDNNGVIQVTGSNAVLDNVKLVGGGQNTYGHTIRVDMEAGSVTTIKNSTISGAFRCIQSYALNGTLLIENTTLAPQCYCLNVDGGTGKLVVNKSTLKGWTSYTSSVESAIFTDCTFEVNPNSYQYNCVRAYTDTTFVNCDFGDEFWFGAANNAVTVTFENCRYKGTLITESNVSDILEPTDNANTTVVVK